MYAFTSLLLFACAPEEEVDPAAEEAAANAHCGGYAGYLQPGRSWRYLGLDEARDFSDIVLTTLAKGKVTIDQDWDRTSDHATVRYACSADGVSRTASDTTTLTGSKHMTYGGACAEVKADMAVGDTWDCVTTVHREDISEWGESEVTEWESSVHAEVTDGGEITVRAGTWDTLKVTRTSTRADWPDSTQNAWYTQDIGKIIDDSEELIDYTE